jgi:hypothetical protein
MRNYFFIALMLLFSSAYADIFTIPSGAKTTIYINQVDNINYVASAGLVVLSAQVTDQCYVYEEAITIGDTMYFYDGPDNDYSHLPINFTPQQTLNVSVAHVEDGCDFGVQLAITFVNENPETVTVTGTHI